MPLDAATAGRLKEALATVVVIPVTPMRPTAAPSGAPTRTYLVRQGINAGITVVTANGNTGEFYALTPDGPGRPPRPRSEPRVTRPRGAATPTSWRVLGTTRPARSPRPGTRSRLAPP